MDIRIDKSQLKSAELMIKLINLSKYDELENLLYHDAEVNSETSRGRTPMFFAAENPDPRFLQILIRHKADVNHVDELKTTPLHWACYKNNVECARVLLENGANPNKVSSQTSSLNAVTSRDQIDIVDDEDPSTFVRIATPLHFSCMKSNLPCVKLLLEYNADPNIKSSRGWYPMEYQIDYHHRHGFALHDDSLIARLLVSAMAALPDFHNKPWPKEALQQLLSLSLRKKEERLVLEPVLSLKHLARCCVRKSLGKCHLPTVINQLQIPASLKDYLTLIPEAPSTVHREAP